MKVIVFGKAGQLGRELVRVFTGRGHSVTAFGRNDVDVSSRSGVEHAIATTGPDLVLNATAYNMVDVAEEEPDAAFSGNALAVRNIAVACRQSDARLVHFSTDYVFDGKGSEPYPEDGPVGPLSVYGQTKLDGERRVLAYDRSTVVRTSWLFGPGGPNFVATIVRLIEEGRHLRVVRDQEGAPTYTLFLARAILDLALLKAKGVVHYRNREAVSWYDFASEIAGLWSGTHRVPEVVPVMTTEFPRPAPRPAYSVLDVSHFQEITGRRVEPWGWGLAEYLTALRKDRKEVR